MEHFLHAVSQIPGRRFFLRTVPALPDQLGAEALKPLSSLNLSNT